MQSPNGQHWVKTQPQSNGNADLNNQVDKLSLQTADVSYVPPQSVARLDNLNLCALYRYMCNMYRALTRLKQLSLGLVSLTTEQVIF